jgi:hypothetical protein
MPDPARAVPPALPAPAFRALFNGFELRTAAGKHVAVPKGTPWYARPGLTGPARQISSAPRCAA